MARQARTGPITAPAGAGAETMPDRRVWLALVVVLAAQFMAIFDQFVVNVALASIQRDLSASLSEVEFVVAGYALAYAVLLVTGGRLGDLVGRKRLFILGMAVFTLASALCGAAPSITALIGFRVLQGLGAAIMTPQVLAIIQTTFTGRSRDTAFGLFGVTNGLGGILGQTFGGFLVRADLFGLGWRAAFLINVPIGIAGVLLAALLIRESRSPAGGQLDLGGVALVSTGLVLLITPLIVGGDAGWAWWVWLCLAASIPVLALFVWYEYRVRRRGGVPLMDPALFREPFFRLGMIARFILFAANAGYFLILALTLQIGLHFSPFDAGLAFFPDALGFFIAATLTPRLMRLLGIRLVNIGLALKCAGLMTAIAVVGVAREGLTGLHLAPSLFVQGFGTGLTAAPLVSFLLAGVRGRDVGAASGVLNTAQQVSTAFGVALTGVIFAALLAGNTSAAAYTHAFAVTLGLLVVTLWVSFAVLLSLPNTHPQPTEEAVVIAGE